MIDVIMPMLGKGTRLQGYQNTLKPLIELQSEKKPHETFGMPMFVKALTSLKNYEIDNLVLVIPKEYEIKFRDVLFLQYFDARELPVKFNHLEIITHDYTETPVETVDIGNGFCKCKNPVIVLDCDIYAPLPVIDFNTTDANLFVFKHDNPNKSFVLPKEGTHSVVERVVEKEMVSNLAVMGAYGFKSADFLEDMMNCKGMKYMSDLMNAAIHTGHHVSFVELDPLSVKNYGTLEELRIDDWQVEGGNE